MPVDSTYTNPDSLRALYINPKNPLNALEDDSFGNQQALASLVTGTPSNFTPLGGGSGGSGTGGGGTGGGGGSGHTPGFGDGGPDF